MDYYRSITSAIITAIAYQTFGFVGLISLIPLFNIKNNLLKNYWLWGATYMGILHAFFIELHTVSSIPIAIGLWLICTLYYSIFYLILGFIIHHLTKKTPHILCIPIAFLVIESLKSFGTFGNTLGNIGYSLAPFTNIISSYSLIGTSGITIIIVLINLLIIKIIKEPSNKRHWATLLIVSSILFFGNGNAQTSPNKSLKATIIHTHINQIKKISKSNWKYLEKTYLNLIQKSPESFIILPESIIPSYIEETPFFNTLNSISNNENKSILFGTHLKRQGTIFNGSILLSNNQTYYYFKERLMPFGEFLPFRGLLNPLIPKDLAFNDFTAGKNNPPISINNISIHQKICLEGIYPITGTVPDLVIIMANNAWFNKSSASKKLNQFAQAHAAEIGRPTVISSNFGTSIIINHRGVISKKSTNNTHEQLTDTLLIPTSKTIYSRFPYGFISIIVLIFLSQTLLFRKKSH